MAVLGDRAVAGLLSALAEAPDFRGGGVILADAARRDHGRATACMLRLDAAHEAHRARRCRRVRHRRRRRDRIPLSDLSSPLVISSLALAPHPRPASSVAARRSPRLESWVALPMSQPPLSRRAGA